ncbi:MAG: prepilin-type N-terminal cleavage/methylation domain-containing protein [Planctomycetes bacterium]|nr:prepilin-type N-terminal cleavage/methylation domain-containing protein [Planctomycetota bacterium]
MRTREKKTGNCKRSRRCKRNGAFTLVEILLVVVILGVLAAIVIPQFSEATSEANLNTLLGNLQTLRSQIELYKVQHYDLLPGQATVGGDVDEADFVAALTNDATYGSYVSKIPENLFIADAANRDAITCVNNAAAAPAGNEGTGWWFNAANGDFRACDSLDSTQY